MKPEHEAAAIRLQPAHDERDAGFSGSVSISSGALSENACTVQASFVAPEHGYELRGKRDEFVSWHECVLDACDALRDYAGPATIVRCSDSALIRVRHPKRARPCT